MCLGIALSASARDKRRVYFVVSAENSRYIQAHSIEVGDTPEHKLRLYELKRTLPADAPVFEGVRLSEPWIRGISDFIEVNGLATTDSVCVFENGGKIFARSVLVAVTDGGKSNTLAAGRMTGGTGKFRSARGIIRVAASPDAGSGVVRSTFEIDYWMEK